MRAFHTLVLHDDRAMVVSLGGCQPRTCSWWNETYDISDYMAPLDGGVPADSGPGADSGAGPDAGPDGGVADAAADTAPPGVDAGGPLPDDGGCGCTVPRTSSASGLNLLGLLGIVGLLAIRRRRRSVESR
ncbi:MAG: MYXO-CTERM sorting domain-containing protein [Deltaproteobacteria bacterium]|nr:MYXO-CTERM sorting domain-containing protein [Deltaproteobacteria bacterium]